ncbi:hypothetical protein [Saccharopolyspora griseoalba]|uniref:Uncharacterized protein n=1 Tax=Saccharopolyspora griseoalba TaxID=1431848 RepID=A0ABW2LSP4_9PSEU
MAGSTQWQAGFEALMQVVRDHHEQARKQAEGNGRVRPQMIQLEANGALKALDQLLAELEQVQARHSDAAVKS